MDMENKKGTTTIGLVCKDGVVIATEHKIDDHLAMTTAGLVGDAQMLARYLKVETDLYRLQRGSRIPVKGAATLMSNILNQRKFAPFYVQLIIGGVDTSGPHVFSIDAAGGSIEDEYTTTGSGSPYVFGVLEDHYREGITVDEGVDLSIRALSAAMKRDSASGNGMDIAVITPKEYREITQEEIEKRKKNLEIS